MKNKPLVFAFIAIVFLFIVQGVFNFGYGIAKREITERMQMSEAFLDCMSTQMNDADRFALCGALALKLKNTAKK